MMIEQLEQALNRGDNNQAQALIQSLSDTRGTGAEQIPLVNICLKHGFYDLSVQCFAKAANDEQCALQVLPLLKEPLLKDSPDLALSFLISAHEQQPANRAILVAMVDRLLEANHLDAAINVLNNALTDTPDAELLSRLAEGYFRKNSLHEAKAAAMMALEASADDPQNHINIAIIERALNNLPQAAKHFGQALALDDENTYAHINLAQLSLTCGNFEQGWQEHEWRWREGSCHVEEIALPLWQGEKDSSHQLLLWADQGLGDQILFLSLLPKIQAEITVKVDPRLSHLLPASVKQIHHDYQGDYSEFDSHMALGSIGTFLIQQFSDIEPQGQYLTAPPLANVPLELTNPAQKVIGFSWRGGSFGTSANSRSLALEFWQPLFQQADITWVNLQYDTTPEERQLLAECGVVTPAFDLKNDLIKLANTLKQLHGYVGIDNSTIHLAGALDIPTILLLGSGADWRWFTEDTYCHWYKSVTLNRSLPEQQDQLPDFYQTVLSQLKTLLTR